MLVSDVNPATDARYDVGLPEARACELARSSGVKVLSTIKVHTEGHQRVAGR